jgi:PAS domain S-box-containing protein
MAPHRFRPKAGIQVRMKVMPLRSRVLFAFAVVLLCLIALVGSIVRYYGQLLEAQYLSTHSYELVAATQGLELSLDSDRGMAYCALTGEHPLGRNPQLATNYEARYRELLELTSGDDEQQQRLSRIDALWGQWQSEYLNPIAAFCALPAGVPRASSDQLSRLAQRGNVLRQRLRAELNAMEETETATSSARQSELTTLRSLTAAIIAVMGAVTLLLALFTATSLARAASRLDRLNRDLASEATQRGAIERRLTNSEMRVRTILEYVPDGVLTIDPSGTIQSLNPAAERIFGYQAGDLIGRNINALVPDSLGVLDPRLAESGQALPPEGRRELLGVRADGTRIAIDLSITEVQIDGERLFTGIVRDISDSKRRDEEITRFQTMLDNTVDMIFMFDPITLKFVYANRGTEETLGYSRDALLTMRATDLTASMPEHVFRSHIAPLMDGSRPWLSYEAMQRKRDGVEVPTEVFLQLVRSGSEDPGLFIGIARDLTERRRIDRMKSEFISIISHELRTPLTSIRGSLGLLVGGAAGELPERTKRMVEIAHHNSERLVRLINDMLDMEKIESGKMRFDMRPLEVAALIDHALDANAGYAEQYDVTLSAASIDPALRVYGDFDRLIQVMNNLLSNAAKFSPTGGKVLVSATQEGSMVRISVADNGGGIPVEFRERVFERFSQADTSDTRKKGGTGLGLSISKAIVERHDGVIGFESIPGSGATFWFDLPQWHSPVRALAPNPADAPRGLVCDDNVDVADLLSILLRDAGYEVDIAFSAEEARNLLSARRYSVMTLDITLPGQDGISLIRQLKSEGHVQVPPLVVVSGYGDAQRDELAGEHTVLDWLDKPIDGDRLLAAVRRAVRGKHDRVRILHIEDDADVRQVLQTLVGKDVVVSAASSVVEARRYLRSQSFDLVVLDVGLPDASGIGVLAHMVGLNATTPVLVFSAHEPSSDLSARVSAVLVKSRTSNQQLLDAISRLVASHHHAT